MWKALIVIILLGVGAAAAWVMAGSANGPVIEITGPATIGQTGEIDVSVTTPRAALKRFDVSIVQGGTSTTLFSLTPGNAAELQADGDRVTLKRPAGKRTTPELKHGTAQVTVTAIRPVLFGFREAASTMSRGVEVNLNPPQVAVLSALHYINHGGSEMVVYRVTPPDAESGVRVGDYEYRGFPASGAGIRNGDPGLKVAFFALLWDQDLNAPIRVYARDSIGNEGSGTFDSRVFPKSFRASRIDLDDRFLAKVVPPILQNSTELKVDDPTDLLASYLKINRELRRMNNETISALARETSPELLWHGPFKQLTNTAVEAGFADQRTYVYKGQDVDKQVHLGFDLASTAGASVRAANRGRVVHAGWLGIYGNCVIVDHGMGLQSLYAHLSSIGVKAGDMVELDSELGRSGSTGLAGGDHLHFTMLLGGNAITPIDWWSAQWVQDRILRKLTDAGATSVEAGAR
ncbi:MAG TPA: M23 family metallopeptidase [Gammaproteobacteria bacterium]|nr:M23 family metallopeptidase [Gammaproteobacteria bacterium]